MKLSKEQLMGIVRHTMTFLGGLLIAKGLIDDATLLELIGGATTLAGAIWSIVAKKSQN